MNNLMAEANFNVRTIANAETLGQKLKRVRVASKFSLEQISEQLQIKVAYLQAIEDSKYTLLPSKVFVKNYIQRYVKLLGLSWATVEPLLQAELEVYERDPNIPTMKRHLTKRPLNMVRVVVGLLIVFLVISIGAYFGLEITNIVEPPLLELDAIPSQVNYSERSIIVSGQTSPEAVVSINDQSIPVLPNGEFSQSMALQVGTNVLKIEAKTKRSRPQTQYMQVYVKDQ